VFADKFKSFHVGQKMADELVVPYPKDQSHKAALSFERYSVTNMELFKANFAKEVLLMRRNSFVYIFKTVQVLIIFSISVSLCHLLALFLSAFALGGAALIFVGFPHVLCNEAIACGN
jgi:hypothetical protein